jgi:deoxycytidylate deaminase
MATVPKSRVQAVPTTSNAVDSRTAVLEFAAGELVFAVVGHVGSGTSTIAQGLRGLLQLRGYDVEILKARDVIAEWATKEGIPLPDDKKRSLDTVEGLQDLGDRMRLETRDHAAVAKGVVRRIQELRAKKTGVKTPIKGPVPPDGKKRAYIIDSIRHPAEVELLRHIYQDAFLLVGVVCEEQRRLSRVMKKFEDAGEIRAQAFMKRDEKAIEKHGQRVSDAFHLSDFFLDNTVERFDKAGAETKDWNILANLERLIKIIEHSEIVRPEISETAMNHAFAAAMQSACLSRQVGAALVDATGAIVATGTNEVPQAGGGVYGEDFEPEERNDHRCAFRRTGTTAYCSNTTEQNKIVDELINEVPELKALDKFRREALKHEIRRGKVGDILEFSRAVHAEMDALLSAGRDGISTRATRLYVTTFPCHYCARHIVSAGIDKVEYIEPYPKSQALSLHADAIQVEPTGWVEPSKGGTKVLFSPFVGVSPRMYRRAFLKNRDLKDPDTGKYKVGQPEWGTAWHLRAKNYAELEAKLAESGE